MLPDTYWIGVAALGVVAAAAGLVVRRRRRVARLGRRRRALLDELDRMQIDVVELLQRIDGQSTRVLGTARVARRGPDILRHRQGLLLAADDMPRDIDVVLRFDVRGVQHDMRARVVGRMRTSRRARKRLNVDATRLFLLMPQGVIVRRERRDMMRFFVGEEAAAPDNMLDAGSLVRMTARVGVAQMHGGDALPKRLRADRLAWLSTADSARLPVQALGDMADVPTVEVADFSVSGLQVEATSATIEALCRSLGVACDDDGLEQLADQILVLRIRVDLDFPERAQGLEPDQVQHPVWALAEVARITVYEVESSNQWWARLGLNLVYQPEAYGDDAAPDLWMAITATGESDALQALHSALNRAEALRAR